MDLPSLLPRARIAAIFMLLAILALCACSPQAGQPSVVHGRVDCSSWNFSKDGPVRLFGQWAFSWRPEQSGAGSEDLPGKDYFHVPGLWQGKSAAGRSISPKGNAVYTVRVLLPENHPKNMALLVAGGMSVCEMHVDGARLASSGVLGGPGREERPDRHFIRASFRPESRFVQVSLHVSNFHNAQGGLNGEVLLGSAEQIAEHYTVPQFLAASMAGGLLCLSLLYTSLFFMRGSGRENIHFGLFCFFWCVGILFSPSSGFLMTRIAPSIPWEWYINCSMLPYAATVPLMLMFYQRLLPKPFGKSVERFYLALGLCFAVYILATPPNGYDKVLFFYFLMSNAALVYMFVCFGVDLVRRERGVFILAFGYLALAMAELEDLLFDLHIIDVPSLRPVGIFLFILSYAFFLAYRYSRSMMRIQLLAGELEIANTRLLRADRLKDEFLANTTHELKTPLAGMIGIAESLIAESESAEAVPEAKSSLPESARPHLEAIVLSGRRLSKLVDDVLAFSRLRSSDMVLQPEPVGLHDLAGRVLALAKGVERGHEVALRNEIPVDFPCVQADPDRMEQVLFNLIGNSLKFTRSGAVTLAARAENGFVEVSVSDTGTGIAPEDMERIFRPYEQAGTQAAGGTGIGLFVARKLVELHGGRLWAESKPGRGSVFRFTLPLDDASGTSADAIPPAASGALDRTMAFPGHAQAVDGPCTVLVVDDEPLNLRVASSILDLDGLAHCTALDGREALRMIGEGLRPELVLLDVMMPDMNGFEVCRRLRREFSASELPVVLLTVRNRAEDVVEGFAAGANDYLTKPFFRDELRARVRTQLRLKQAFDMQAENATLRREIDARRQTEAGLRHMRARLAMLFDSLEDALLVANASGEIVFCNSACRTLLERGEDEVLGRSVSLLSEHADSDAARRILDFCRRPDPAPQSADFCGLKVGAGQTDMAVDIRANRVEVEEETLCLMTLALAGDGNNAHDVQNVENAEKADSLPLSVHLLRELDRNRQRVAAIEEALQAAADADPEQQRLLDDVRSLEQLLKRIDGHMRTGQGANHKRGLGVRVMNLAVDCWVEATAETKADLAERSGLWRVYMERDGYIRTQTLDKYLDAATLPANPRWKTVLATAEYVMANCADSPRRTALEHAFAELRTACGRR